MLYNTALVGAAAFASLTLAAPTAIAQEKQSGTVQAFSISQVPVPQSGYRKNGAREYAKALRKYKLDVPQHVKHAADAAAAAQSGSVSNQPEANDEAYLSPVQFASTGQTLMLDFDTGSSDLWVFSTEQPASQTQGHTAYAAQQDTANTGETWSISYGDGSGASGNVYPDTVTIGGVTATSQAVEAATSVSSEFTSDVDTDGLVGLGFSSINTVKPNPVGTFFDTVKPSLASPLFAAYLRHNAAGSYDFGATDPDHYSGTIGYTDVNTANGFWEFTAGTYSVAGQEAGTLGDSIADTGTSIMLVPADVAENYYSLVDEAEYSEYYGGFIYPCGTELPSFTVNIAGADRVVPGSYIDFANIESNVCYGGIQYNEGLPFSILGDTFLKSQYVVFSGASTPQIGFATQK